VVKHLSTCLLCSRPWVGSLAQKITTTVKKKPTKQTNKKTRAVAIQSPNILARTEIGVINVLKERDIQRQGGVVSIRMHKSRGRIVWYIQCCLGGRGMVSEGCW
jgi:hypothetical protein